MGAEDIEPDFLKIRKVPTVQKPKSTIIDGSIKINKKNLPTSHPMKDAKKSDKSEKSDSSSKRRSSDKDRSRKGFRPDHRDEVNPEEKQRIKDMARKMKEEAQAKKEKTTTSSLGKIPKIPKKTPPADDSKKSKSFEEMLGGLDSKPKTVKTTSIVKNKTAALLEGMKSSSSSSSSKSSSSSSKSSSSSRKDHDHHRSSSHHKKDSHHSSRDRDHHSSSHSSSRSKDKPERKLSLTMPTTPEPSKKKENESPKSAKSPQVYAESSSFMDALFSSMGVPTARKKKRRLSESKDEKSPPAKASRKDSKDESSKEDLDAKDNTEAVSENTPTENTPTFSFYQDTLETSKEDITEEKIENDTDMKDVENNESSDEQAVKETESMEEELPFEDPDSMPREVKGILVYHRGRAKRDKKITWRPETELVAVQYFEVDENERVNVNKLKFENMREFESKMEKAAMKSKNAISDDDHSTVLWYKPKRISVTNREPFTPGHNSKERSIQNDREKSVLQEIYFTREMTPDTPKEADPDSNTMRPGQPATIPTEDAEADENGVLHYAHKPWPIPKENQVSQQAQFESQFSLPPALSDLLSSINKTGVDGIIP